MPTVEKKVANTENKEIERRERRRSLLCSGYLWTYRRFGGNAQSSLGSERKKNKKREISNPLSRSKRDERVSREKRKKRERGENLLLLNDSSIVGRKKPTKKSPIISGNGREKEKRGREKKRDC